MEKKVTNPDLIPQELKQTPNWVLWTVEERDGKPTKVPLNPKTEGRAKSNTPSTWATFEEAQEAYKACENDHIAGLGFVFSKDDPFSGTDLDHCRNPQTGEIESWAIQVINTLNSYSEVSPSSEGVKIFTRGSLPLAGSGSKNGQVEMYHRGRFFAVTGRHLEGTPLTIEPRHEELKQVYNKFFGHRKSSPSNKLPPSPVNASDSQLIEKARQASNGDKFSKLWAGDWSDYPSPSEADLALCSILAFWTGNNPAQIDRIFRQSGLMRPKWDERHFGDGLTYGQKTIQTAIEGTSDTYNSTQKVSPTGEEALLKYHLTDVGNAESFCELNGKDFNFIKEKKVWTKFDGVRWGEAKEEIKRKMIETMRLKSQIAMKVFPPDSEQMKQIVKWCLSSESNFRLSAAMDIATIYTTKSHNDFDNDPWLLACTNAVIDLKTGQIRTPTPQDMLQKSINLSFDGRAVCRRWLQFLQEILGSDEEVIDFIQRAIGYTLTGLTKEQCLFILYGTGANGKSVFLSILEGLLGEYGQTTSFSMFKEKKYDCIPNDLARIAGARMVKSVEIKEGTRLNEERIKALTGGDRMMARFLHNEFFEFDPIAKFWLAVNHKPIIRGTDEAIWRRIRLIPFEQTFPPERRDKELAEKLKKELPGILNWAIEGCLKYQEMGLEPVEKIQNATEQYRAESDVINQFLQDKTEKIDNAEERIKAGDLYTSYKTWCEENGEGFVTNTQFGRRMIEKGYERKKIISHKYYLGIRFL